MDLKKALKDAFQMIESQPLGPTRIFMNERDYRDIAGVPCTECGGCFFPTAAGSPHPHDDCQMEKVRQVMET